MSGVELNEVLPEQDPAEQTHPVDVGSVILGSADPTASLRCVFEVSGFYFFIKRSFTFSLKEFSRSISQPLSRFVLNSPPPPR